MYDTASFWLGFICGAFTLFTALYMLGSYLKGKDDE